MTKLPMYRHDTEKWFLRSIIHGDNFKEIVSKTPSNFEEMLSTETHKIIFSIIKKLTTQNIRPDIITVSEEVAKIRMQNASLLEDAIDIVKPIAPDEPLPQMETAEAIEHYIQEIKDGYIGEKTKTLLQHINIEIENGESPADYLTKITSEINKLTSTSTNIKGQTADELNSSILDDWLHPKKYEGLDLGFPKMIRRAIGGLEGGQLLSICARTSVGKSALAMNMAINTMLQNKRVIYFDFELSDRDFKMRQALPIARVDEGYYKLSEDEIKVMQEKNPTLFNTITKNLTYSQKIINEKGKYFKRVQDPLTVEQICNYVLAEHISQRVDLVVLDHIKAMNRTFSNENENQNIHHIMKSLKSFSKIHNIPFIVVCQINRKGVAESDKYGFPLLHHIDGSGGIEQYSDAVIMLHRPYLSSNEETQINDMYAAFKKNRRGTLSMFTLKAELQYFSVKDGVVGLKSGAFQSEPLDKKSPEAKEAKALFQKKK